MSLLDRHKVGRWLGAARIEDAIPARLDSKGGCLRGAFLRRRRSPPRPHLLSRVRVLAAVVVVAAALGVTAVVNDVAVAAGGRKFPLRDVLLSPGRRRKA